MYTRLWLVFIESRRHQMKGRWNVPFFIGAVLFQIKRGVRLTRGKLIHTPFR